MQEYLDGHQKIEKIRIKEEIVKYNPDLILLLPRME